MANEEHLRILEKGVREWNAWRVKNRGVKPDLCKAGLRGAELRHADLSEADFNEASLVYANLCDADLREANLRGADLTRANARKANLNLARLWATNLFRADLRGAVLTGADLSFANLGNTRITYHEAHVRRDGANLSGANLQGAKLQGANLSGAILSGAKLRRAQLWDSIVVDIDLSEVRGLEDCVHRSSSTIGTGTFSKSKGRIPEAFLRGCGLQDWEIVAAKLHGPDLTPQQVTDIVYAIDRIRGDSPIKVNPLFISYSRIDSDFVDALELRLDEKRIRFWRDTHDMKAGPIEAQIERAIEVNRILLLVLSKNSVESDWVEYEVMRARELEKERKEHILCPIAIDDAWKTCSWDRRLRVQIEKYNILDFSEWQDEGALGAAFQKLVDGLGLFYPTAS